MRTCLTHDGPDLLTKEELTKIFWPEIGWIETTGCFVFPKHHKILLRHAFVRTNPNVFDIDLTEVINIDVSKCIDYNMIGYLLLNPTLSKKNAKKIHRFDHKPITDWTVAKGVMFCYLFLISEIGYVNASRIFTESKITFTLSHADLLIDIKYDYEYVFTQEVYETIPKSDPNIKSYATITLFDENHRMNAFINSIDDVLKRPRKYREFLKKMFTDIRVDYRVGCNPNDAPEKWNNKNVWSIGDAPLIPELFKEITEELSLPTYKKRPIEPYNPDKFDLHEIIRSDSTRCYVYKDEESGSTTDHFYFLAPRTIYTFYFLNHGSGNSPLNTWQTLRHMKDRAITMRKFVSKFRVVRINLRKRFLPVIADYIMEIYVDHLWNA